MGEYVKSNLNKVVWGKTLELYGSGGSTGRLLYEPKGAIIVDH